MFIILVQLDLSDGVSSILSTLEVLGGDDVLVGSDTRIRLRCCSWSNNNLSDVHNSGQAYLMVVNEGSNIDTEIGSTKVMVALLHNSYI